MVATALRYPCAANIGARIRAIRERYEWSTTELAQRTGFSQSQISVVELGRLNTPIETLARIADALHVPLDDLLKEPDQPPAQGLPWGSEDMLRWAMTRPGAISKTLRDLADELDALVAH